MIALLLLLGVIFLLALLFSYLAENPGTVTLVWDGTLVEVGLITAIAATIALIAAVMLVWWVIKGLVRAPGAIVDNRRGRARDKGYRALSEGMMALGAGDVNRARELARQADRRLGHTREPMVLLLEAQTLMAEDKHDEARHLFDEMLETKETRPLALRGLFLEAQREGEHAAARHYAERAAALSPHHLWATDATIEYAALDGDYDRALEIVDDQERTKSINKGEATRKRAVLLTGKAMGEIESEPSAARDHARKAHKLDPALVPATVTEARAHIRLNEQRKATSCLSETWKRATHPDIADLYTNVQPGASAATRLSRAKELEAMKPGDVESLLVVAHAALDAGDHDLAREKATEAVRIDPREGAFLLLADIEEASGGNPSRVRHWLQSALRAPRDPAWVADGFVSERWAPVSPVTGRFDAFEWRRPARELDGPAIDADEALRALPPATDSPRGTPPRSTPTADVDDAEIVVEPVTTVRPVTTRAAADRSDMVDMDGPIRAVPAGTAREDAVTVMTGERTMQVSEPAPTAPATSPAPAASGSSSAPRRTSAPAGTPNGLGGDAALAMAVTTPPGGGSGGSATSLAPEPANRTTPSSDEGGEVLATGVAKRPGAMRAATDGAGGEERQSMTGPSRELRGIDLKSRTTTRQPDAGRRPAPVPSADRRTDDANERAAAPSPAPAATSAPIVTAPTTAGAQPGASTPSSRDASTAPPPPPRADAEGPKRFRLQ